MGALCFWGSALSLADREPAVARGELILSIFMSVFGPISVAVGISLWRMNKWGWWIGVVGASLGIAVGVFNLFLASGAAILGALIGLALSGWILYWFIKNRQLFN